jgi:hypothetical protein
LSKINIMKNMKSHVNYIEIKMVDILINTVLTKSRPLRRLKIALPPSASWRRGKGYFFMGNLSPWNGLCYD